MSIYQGPIFDGDTHVQEIVENFNRHLPKKFHDYRVQRHVSADGKFPYYVGETRCQIIEDFTRPDYHIPKPGSIKEFLKAKQTGDEDYLFVPLTPDIRTRTGRLQRMDEQKVEASIVFPGEIFAVWPYIDNIEARDAVIHAYNQWLEDDWGFNWQSRIYATPILMLNDLDRAVAEVEWIIRRGARIVVMPVGPWGGRSPADPYFDPVWSRLNDARITVAFHIGESFGMHSLLRDWGEKIMAPRHSSTAWFWMNAYGEVPLVHTLSSLIYLNLFGRFPNLKMLSVENGTEWIPRFLKKLDTSRSFAKSGYWPCGQLTERPSAIFKRHVFSVPYPEDDVALLIQAIGSECLIMGSDFPHPEGVKAAGDYADMALSGLPSEQVRAIMYDNGRRLLPAS